MKWKCTGCGAHGDHLDIAASALGLRNTSGRNYHAAKRWLEGGDDVEVPAVEVAYQPPRRADVGPALARAVAVAKASDPRLGGWLARRHLKREIPAGWLPDYIADWWRSGWSQRWPIVVPLCGHDGHVESLQGICPEDSDKRWPWRAEARDLLFADLSTRAWLRGDALCPKVLVIVEGVMDYLTCAPEMPTLGVASGFEGALERVTIDDDTDVFFGTHLDAGAGRRYQTRVTEILRRPVRRLKFEDC